MSEQSLNLVMLIDDNPTDRFVHRKLLEIHKICQNTIEFEGARDALNYFRQEKGPVPEVILLDILMPDMDGFDFLAHYANIIPRLQPAPRLFMLSSTDDEKDIRRIRENPLVVKLLRKPFTPLTLKKYLSEL